MKRRDFLKLVGAGAASTFIGGCQLTAGNKTATTEKPNLIFILCDDLGYGNLSCYGSKKIDTPNLDALASEGMKFTQFYSGSPVCTPARVSCMTGHYPLRYNVTSVWFDREQHLPDDTVTIADMLKSGGYATAHVGKWNLGGSNKHHFEARAAGKKTLDGPLQRGFDQFFTMLEGPGPHIDIGRAGRFQKDGAEYLIRNEKPVEPSDQWMDEVFGNEALKVIDGYHKENRRFFMNFCFYLPHTPYEAAPEPHLNKYKARGATGNDLKYRSMVSNLDSIVGRIVDKLKELDMFDNTLIIFTSDNGPTNATPGSAGQYRAGKATLYEGGIRVPMIATWPGHIPPNSQTDTLGHTNDILPTMCQAGGVKVPDKLKIDGKSLIDHMTKGESIDRGTVFWQFVWDHDKNPENPSEVARNGKWKLLTRDGNPLELYDLEKDPGEKTNLLEKEPKIAEELGNEIKNWLAEPRKAPRYRSGGGLYE